ncbi:hypothetical protein DM02DRAFT_71331 [Periconia macrospinosa]|uniref:DUF6604 domain-containing protein n=1 Tax=Periconia macrospinosa TaxID=97972 RepID=A0A2V1E816_9PLEO|nr:hypothetical protein DM02DRAFT_71331 [Periconia macrospinosa]
MAELSQAQTFLAKYNLYKQATEYIGGWIAETAASIGFEVPEKNQKQPQTKARSKKRGGKKNNPKPKAAAVPAKIFQIRVADFVPMANAIAAVGSEVDSEIMVPVAMCKYFNCAIQTRRQVSKWFKAKFDGDRASDARHEYFIHVLEDTFATLRPFLRTSGPKAARKDAPSATQNGVTTHNRFAGLTVEEAAALADEEDFSEENLPKVFEVELQQDEDDGDEEFWIALSLLLQEQQDMREIVRKSWSNYKDGTVDLIVAAMVTDTAIKLAQKSEAEFELLVTRPKQWPVAKYPVGTLPAVLFYNNHDTFHQWPLEEIAKPSNRLGITAVGQTEAHFDFWPVYAGLKFYLHKHVTRPKTVPQVVPQDLQEPEVHERTLRSIELAQIMRLVKEAQKRPKLWDAVSQGLLSMFSTHTIPIWLTFGVQLHFDSQDILGDKVAKTHFELEVYLNEMMAEVQEMKRDWEEPFIPEGYVPHIYVPIEEAFTDIDPWANRDGLADQWAALSKYAKVAGHPTLKLLKSEKMYFFRHHPLLNGMMKYHFFLHWHAFGLSYENCSVSLLMMSHVYVGTRLRHPEVPV